MPKKRCTVVLADPSEFSEDVFAKLKKELGKHNVTLHSVYEEAGGFWRLVICPKGTSKKEAERVYDKAYP